MKKIPTIFERDWAGDRSRVIDKLTPGCEWFYTGDFYATQKHDGTCCLMRDGKLYRRFQVKPGKKAPIGFEEVDADDSGKRYGWVLVTGGPSDRWHLEAFSNYETLPDDGTYELCGPRVQGNPEGYSKHVLVPHGQSILTYGQQFGDDLSFRGVRAFLQHAVPAYVEGIVFWDRSLSAPIGKIKKSDFGIPVIPAKVVGGEGEELSAELLATPSE